VLDLGPDLDRNGAFTDTAAIMANLDLVITSDTSIAHLAGALGVPTWLALPFSPDWRWLLEREYCPWYPSMRLFRQKKRGDWADVFERMAAEVGRASLPVPGAKRTAREGRPTEDPTLAPYLLLLGKALTKQGRHEEAVGCFREVLRLDPESDEAEGGLGLSCVALGQNPDAVHSLERCLALHPGQADIHCHLGVALFRLERADEAMAQYRQTLRLKPDHADAHNNLGNALRAAGQLDAASSSLRQAIRLRPDLPEAHFLLGSVLAQQGKHDEAEIAFARAIEHRPAYFSALLQRGTSLAELGRHEEAIACLRQAAKLQPQNGEVPYRLGISLRLSGKEEEAIAAYRESIRIKPAVVEPWLHLGVTLATLERFEEAETAYRQGLRHKPNNADLLNNLGLALKNQGRVNEALQCFAESLRLAPDHVEAHRNRGMTLLSLGDLKQGWPEYEWQLARKDRPGPRFIQPRWDGSRCATVVSTVLGPEHGRDDRGTPLYRSTTSATPMTQPGGNGTPLAGRTILLYPEQGIGDFMQFVRYASQVKEQGARVLLLCPPSLVPLMRSYGGIDELIVQGSPLPPFDVHASLMSLPLLLGTTLESIPATVPYLSADAGLMERWSKFLGRLAGFKVGIGWQGNPQYVADRGRSMPLRSFAPLAGIPGVQLVSLQKGPGVEQLSTIDFPLISFDRQADETTGAFMDTAAIMHQLDLVITSDTALAHLAGALGVSVWVVLGPVPDWRWLLDRDDSPWYPSMRLFRRQQGSDWEEGFTRMA
jgi:tetratricopeptide (TPR) repeat protein